MNKKIIRVVRKLQFLSNYLIKTAVLQAESRKTARLAREPTGFPNKSILVSFLAAIMIISGLGSCATNKGIDYAHNSKNSLDWAGVYTGTIPSASGSGINVRLRLNSDQSYALSYDYLERPNSQFDCTGSFKWDNKGSTVILDVKDMPSYYKVIENALIQLDMKGKQIKGILADDYVLKKER